MNEELAGRVKEELVMLSLFQQIKIEKRKYGDGINVFFNELPFFRVTERDGKYTLFYRTGIAPALETSDPEIIIGQIKHWVSRFMSSPGIVK